MPSMGCSIAWPRVLVDAVLAIMLLACVLKPWQGAALGSTGERAAFWLQKDKMQLQLRPNRGCLQGSGWHGVSKESSLSL